MSAHAATACTTSPETGFAAPLAQAAGRIPGLLWVMCAAEVALVTGVLARWIASGDQQEALHFLRHQGAYLLIGFAVTEYLLALAAWQLFERGHPMRSAWFMLMGASGLRLLGMVLTSCCSGFTSGEVQSPGGASVSATPPIFETGLAIANPLGLALLAAGLFVVLRLHKQVRLLGRPAVLDSIVFAVMGVFLAVRLYMIMRWPVVLPEPAPVFHGLLWVKDPLLMLLLFQATMLRRSALQADGGLVGRAWGAYPVAILLTCAGDLGSGLAGANSSAWHYVYLSSCLWAFASLAYALAPAYQVEAMLRARRPRPGPR